MRKPKTIKIDKEVKYYAVRLSPSEIMLKRYWNYDEMMDYIIRQGNVLHAGPKSFRSSLLAFNEFKKVLLGY